MTDQEEGPGDSKPEGISKNQWKKKLKQHRREQGRAEWKYVKLYKLVCVRYCDLLSWLFMLHLSDCRKRQKEKDRKKKRKRREDGIPRG